jgi:hypothetical protein
MNLLRLGAADNNINQLIGDRCGSILGEDTHWPKIKTGSRANITELDVYSECDAEGNRLVPVATISRLPQKGCTGRSLG